MEGEGSRVVKCSENSSNPAPSAPARCVLAGRCRSQPRSLTQLLRAVEVLVPYSIAAVQCRDQLVLAPPGLWSLHSEIRASCSKMPGSGPGSVMTRGKDLLAGSAGAVMVLPRASLIRFPVKRLHQPGCHRLTSCAEWLQVINDYLLEKDSLKSAHFPDCRQRCPAPQI